MSQVDTVVCQNNAFIQHNASFPIALQLNSEVYFNKNDNKFTDKFIDKVFKDKETNCGLSITEFHSDDEEEI